MYRPDPETRGPADADVGAAMAILWVCVLIPLALWALWSGLAEAIGARGALAVCACIAGMAYACTRGSRPGTGA